MKDLISIEGLLLKRSSLFLWFDLSYMLSNRFHESFSFFNLITDCSMGVVVELGVAVTPLLASVSANMLP